ncbi:tetratricopeptide repeat protein [Sporosarcina jiandibaonis]|uniref:tetratricopeptide repeat protein n=1 Tax=Sporosarcina jiandibaonis TaxID=2715535 RepID=UPI001556A9C9|nr:tetratricopeptide repeat protein [Sporosarcina jiandibaonis]
MIRTNKSKEEKLEELNARLKEAHLEEPLGINATIADLSYRILVLKRSLRIAIPDEENQLIGSMIEHAYMMKTEQRDRNVAKHTFEKILRIEPRNPEANYRYAFLYYEDGNWIRAINHFKQAVQYDDPDFPLAKDQIIKANLFVGYCSIMLAKESIAIADRLSGEVVKTPPGEISIDELTRRLKGELDSNKFLLITNNDKKLISEEEYKEIESIIDRNSLLLDFTTDKPFVQSGEYSNEISIQLARLLKMLLLRSVNDQSLSLAEINGYQEESISDVMHVTWDNYRQKISLINQKLKRVGLPDNVIENIPKRKSYKVSDINYYIVQYDAK